jgi:hypothetical protein
MKHKRIQYVLIVFVLATGLCYAGRSNGVSVRGPRAIGQFRSSITSFSNNSNGLGGLQSRPGTPGAGPLSSPLSRGNSLRSTMGRRQGRGMQVTSNQHSHLGGTRTPNYRLSRPATNKANPYTISRQNPTFSRPGTAALRPNSRPHSSPTPSFTPRNTKNAGKAHATASTNIFTLKPNDKLTLSPSRKNTPKKSSNFEDNVLAMLGTTRDHVEILNQDARKNTTGKNEEIKTLASNNPIVGDHIRKGEAALKLNNYREAFFQFNQAKILSDDSPESNLSLVHTYLASSGDSYSMAGYYLQKSLIRLPDLPLINVPIRPFLSKAEYASMIVRLKKMTGDRPAQSKGHLCLAYVLWRDGDKEGCIKEIRLAFQHATNTETKEAVQIFWDALGSIGIVSGELTAPQPKQDPATVKADPKKATT